MSGPSNSTTTQMGKAAKVLLLMATVAIVCVVSSLLLIVFSIQPVVVDILDPPGSHATTSYHGTGLSSYVVWEKQVFIPETAFASPSEVQQYYETELAAKGWIVPDESLYFSPFEQICNNAAKPTADQERDFSLEVYSTEHELESAPPAPPIQLCLYLKKTVRSGFYEVRLLSIRPGFWDLFNT